MPGAVRRLDLPCGTRTRYRTAPGTGFAPCNYGSQSSRTTRMNHPNFANEPSLVTLPNSLSSAGHTHGFTSMFPVQLDCSDESSFCPPKLIHYHLLASIRRLNNHQAECLSSVCTINHTCWHIFRQSRTYPITAHSSLCPKNARMSSPIAAVNKCLLAALKCSNAVHSNTRCLSSSTFC